MKASASVLALVLAGMPCAAAAQPLPNVFQPTTAAAATLSPQALDQLVAPIALYPDPLLTDILAASTYPAQVVEAQRWRASPENANLQGQALADAAASQGAAQGWDPSVQALTEFPQVLAMMDSELSWTDRLGRAFLGQQVDVMNAVQRLRHEAQLAGTLQNGPQDQVVNDGDNISINPPSPQQYYLPSYDAQCVYGPNANCTAADDFIGWDAGFFLPYGYWQWGALNWGDRAIHVDHGFYNHNGGHYRDRFADAAHQDGDIWHHASLHDFGQFHPAGNFGAPAHYQYAPPANQLLNNHFSYGRPVVAPSFRAGGNGGFHPAAPPAAAVHTVAHGGGGGRR